MAAPAKKRKYDAATNEGILRAGISYKTSFIKCTEGAPADSRVIYFLDSVKQGQYACHICFGKRRKTSRIRTKLRQNKKCKELNIVYTVVDTEHPRQTVNFFMEAGPADIHSRHHIPDPNLESLKKAIKTEVEDKVWWKTGTGGRGEWLMIPDDKLSPESQSTPDKSPEYVEESRTNDEMDAQIFCSALLNDMRNDVGRNGVAGLLAALQRAMGLKSSTMIMNIGGSSGPTYKIPIDNGIVRSRTLDIACVYKFPRECPSIINLLVEVKSMKLQVSDRKQIREQLIGSLLLQRRAIGLLIGPSSAELYAAVRWHHDNTSHEGSPGFFTRSIHYFTLASYNLTNFPEMYQMLKDVMNVWLLNDWHMISDVRHKSKI